MATPEPVSPQPSSVGLWGLLRHRAKAADQLGSKLLNALKETHGIPEDAKVRIQGSVESCVKKSSPYIFWRSWLHAFDEAYLLKLAAVGSALPILVVSVIPEIRESAWPDAAAPIVGPILIAAALGGVLVGSHLATQLTHLLRAFGGRVPAFAITAAILLLVPTRLDLFHDWGWFVGTVQRGLWASGLFFASFLAVAQSLHLAHVITVRLSIRKVPDAEAVTSLLLTLVTVERVARAEGVPPLKPVEVANLLHQLAETVERALPLRFSGVHSEIERRLHEEARSIAAAIDRMGIDALLGAGPVFAVLTSKLGSMLVHVADGDWISLPRNPAGARPSGQLLLGTQMIVGVVPLLVALGVWSRILPIDASPELSASLVRFGIAWAAIHALLALDPRATEKAEATNKLLTFLN
jgi:hypothetical protein